MRKNNLNVGDKHKIEKSSTQFIDTLHTGNDRMEFNNNNTKVLSKIEINHLENEFSIVNIGDETTNKYKKL